MKILVLSDSHAGLRFMRWCVEQVKPDAIIHLGDYFEDGQVLAQENPHLRTYQVPGNCDRHRLFPPEPEIMQPTIGGVRFYLTHGHLQGVKFGYSRLIADARRATAACVLFGHTHESYAERLEDGLWVMNPGSCGSWGGSCGVVEVENGIITACRILRQAELEEWK